MQRYDIQMSPLPQVPVCAETSGLHGEGITAVNILDASTVQVITKRGVAIGDKDKVLPPELRRMLGHAFKHATKTLGRRRMRRQVPEDMGEDITYDPESTVDKESRPDITPMRDNSKEQEIRRTFHGGKLVLEPEDITTFDSFPEDLPSKHPKEVAIRETKAQSEDIIRVVSPAFLKSKGWKIIEEPERQEEGVLKAQLQMPAAKNYRYVYYSAHLEISDKHWFVDWDIPIGDLGVSGPKVKSIHVATRMVYDGKTHPDASVLQKIKKIAELLPGAMKAAKEHPAQKAASTKRMTVAEYLDSMNKGISVKAASLEVGKTIENAHIRIHRYRDAIEIWDLTNAGKRGKKVDHLMVHDINYVNDATVQSNIEKFEKGLPTLNYQQALRWAEMIAKDAQTRKTYGPKVSPSSVRGVDVAPAGFKPITINTGHLLVEVDYDSFRIKNLDDMYNEPTCIPHSKGGKKSIPQFYRWVQDNQSKIRTMNFPDLLAAITKEGIQFHQYCAID